MVCYILQCFDSCCIGITGNCLMFVFTMQTASPLRLSNVSDGSASSVSGGTVTADFDLSLQLGSSASVKRRQVSVMWL